jgi:hypothetical protein
MEMKRVWQELGFVDTIYEDEDHDECFDSSTMLSSGGGGRLATASGKVCRANLISHILV